jgi:RNA polymerase sigma-70 factor (ECF subfamily)
MRPTPERNRWLADHVLPHEGWIRRVVARLARSAGLEVDDVIQETYAVLVRLKAVDTINDARSYALRVAQSICFQQLRRAKVISIEAVADLGALDAAADAPTPEQHAQGRSELLRVRDAIEAMPEPVRRAFWLRRVEGLSQREVAAALGLSENTVEKQISRGIKLLVEQFARGGKLSPQASTQMTTHDRVEEGRPLNGPTRFRGEH